MYIEKLKSINHASITPLKAFVKTYGCQQNFADSEKIRGLLVLAGYTEAEEMEDADLLIFNTCAVREHAEERVFGNIGALVHFKKRKKDIVIAVCGCMTQQKNICEKFIEKYPFVDIICGTNTLNNLPKMLCEVYFENRKSISNLSGENFELSEDFENIPVIRTSSFKASIPIMYGCNNFCSYCVVPFVRGRERSRSPLAILSEIKKLVLDGVKYILLLGQNVNSYNKDNYNFLKLLEDIDNIEGDFYIDFMTSHPKDASFALIDFIAESKKVTHHLHLPAQSGSNRILKEMNRGYTREKYLEIASYAREKLPFLSLTTDIIVGFPGETKEDFSETINLIKEAKTDAAYTFIYSKRKGTKAAEMPYNIAKEELNSRFNHLCDTQRELGGLMYLRYKGKVLKVLCDSKPRVTSPLPENVTAVGSGKSREGLIVDFYKIKNTEDTEDTEIIYKGKFIEVLITETYHWALRGEMKNCIL